MQSHTFFENNFKRFEKSCTFARSKKSMRSGCGVIGSRARLRIWFRKEYGFESLHPHR